MIMKKHLFTVFCISCLGIVSCSKSNEQEGVLAVGLEVPDGPKDTTVSIVARSLKSDGTEVDSKTFTDVPIRANHRTIYRGEFSTNESMAMTFTTEEWVDDTPIAF